MYGRKRQFSVPVPKGRSGYTDRKCPKCRGRFKIMLGTGLADIEDCHCPYCGCHEPHSCFHTTAQIEYARSVVVDKVTRRLNSKLKRMAGNINRRSRHSGGLLNITMDVKTSPTRVRYPIESKLETYVECSNCTLRYAVYGVYAFCPDCARHNAVQILEINLEISGKLLELSSSSEATLERTLISKSLTDVVSSFDGFGREICRAFSSRSSNPAKAEYIRFQNLLGAQSNIKKFFGFDIADGLATPEWELVIRCFQKRHVLEHKSGVVDEEYKAKTEDPKAIAGRKVSLSKNEVRCLIDVVRSLGAHIYTEMEKLL